jgi:nicotinamide-nucleotide amidase
MCDLSAEILVVGSEHLLGLSVDTNSQLLSRRLAELGIAVYRKTIVGDNLPRLRQAFREAVSRSSLVIAIGGLGPTDDDVTREALADTAEVSLRMDMGVKADIVAKYARRNRTPLPGAFRQALVPVGGEWLPNPSGTAPGLYWRKDNKALAALPGPPQEFEAVLDKELVPRLRRDFPTGRVIISRELHCCGIAESDAMLRLGQLAHSSNPTLAPLANWGLLTLRITARAVDAEAAARLIEPLEEEVESRLKDFVFGYDSDTLEGAIIRQLKRLQQTVACAESMTGGEICRMLSAVPGSSAVFLGGLVVYSPTAKSALAGVPEDVLQRCGTVGEEITTQLALRIRDLLGTTYGIAITGEAGPEVSEPGRQVGEYFIAVAGPSGIVAHHPVGLGNRGAIRTLASITALSFLFRTIQSDKRASEEAG